MNLRIPNDSAIHGNLFNRRLNYTIPTFQPRQDIFDMTSFLAKLRSACRRKIFIVFLHVSTDPARAAAPTDLLSGTDPARAAAPTDLLSGTDPARAAAPTDLLN